MEGLTAELSSGELTCLLGANGAGKSTLLKTLAGFQPALGGELTLFGKSLKDYTLKELALQMGIVLTEKGDLRNMTVWELVSLGRSPYTGFWGRLSARDRQQVADALGLIGIAHLSQRLVHTLSDGERQKAMIAKVLVQQTPIIFLDEPTAFLDFPSKVELMLLLRRLSREMKKTIFLSTHDLELALEIADKIWLMSPEGSLQCGSPEDLALEGSLGAFFSHEGLSFDDEAGLFRVEHPIYGEIAVRGSGVEYSLLCKALRRIGLEPLSQEEGELSILVEDGGYLLYAQGREVFRAKKISSLLEKLFERLF